jgi:hypothetical protein
MSGDPFHGPKLKIKRANEHIGEIDRQCEAYFAGDRYVSFAEHDPQSGEYVIKIRHIDPIPEDLYALIAETAYHLRSSLDQMVVAIARANGVTKIRKLYFPFAKDAKEFESAATKLEKRGLPSDVIELIRKFEPFECGKNRLWGLGPLANIDKHDTLIPMGNVGVVHKIEGLRIHGASIKMPPERGRLDEGIVALRMSGDGIVAGSKDQDNFYISGDIVFGNVDLFQGKSISVTLHQLADLVDRIVQTFAAHCFGK